MKQNRDSQSRDLVRFFGAVLIGGAAFGALMPGMPAFELLSKAPLLYVLSLVLVALVIGLVVTRRGWLAAATASFIGIALWVGIYAASVATVGTVR